MRAARRAAAIALAIVCTAGGASAEQKPQAAPLLQRTAMVEREVDAGYGGGLHVSTGPHGGVQVSAWRERKIRIEARVELSAPTEAGLDALTRVVSIAVDPTPAGVEVLTRGPHDKKWMKGVKGFPKELMAMPWRIDYVVYVPEYTTVAVEVNDGDATVDGVNGIISVISARGDVRLTDIAGATRATAAGGSIAIATHDRGWRDGNLSASASGNVVFTAPAGFSARLTASAPGGVTITDAEQVRNLGGDYENDVGAGGASVTFVAGGKVAIFFGRSP
jgi:hypothetical protein